MTTDNNDANPKSKSGRNPYRPWHARFWYGMRFGPWMSLLVRNKFRVAPGRFGLAFIVTCAGVFNSVMRVVQEGLFYRAIKQATPHEAPIFIIGHWRSGTTLLHELLILDGQFTYANTFQCMAPSHFLVTSGITKYLNFFLPKNRPMDKMALGWDTPQEDEFALANMGLPSPYLTIAFPNGTENPENNLTLENLSPTQLSKWKASLKGFFRRLSVQNNKQLIVKSPTHTARIKTLMEIYPKAKFILITRDPYDVFYSTHKLWTALYKSQALQIPNFEGLNEKILTDFETMFDALENDAKLVPAKQFFQTDYQTLLENPQMEMEKLYRHLNLAGFSSAKANITAYFTERKEYRADSYEIDPQIKRQIDQRWLPHMRSYRKGQPD